MLYIFLCYWDVDILVGKLIANKVVQKYFSSSRSSPSTKIELFTVNLGIFLYLATLIETKERLLPEHLPWPKCLYPTGPCSNIWRVLKNDFFSFYCIALLTRRSWEEFQTKSCWYLNSCLLQDTGQKNILYLFCCCNAWNRAEQAYSPWDWKLILPRTKLVGKWHLGHRPEFLPTR